jgi:mRNA-degrading endonuclease RelE of RelBE toxin-antitoxin system
LNDAPSRFSIEFNRHAEREIKSLPSAVAHIVLQEIQERLSAAPFQEIKTRIKRVTGFVPPLYRLRVGDYRAYYRVIERRVVILAVLHKKDSDRWLRRQG